MNIVTMCRGGNVRSVAAKMILQRYLGHEVLAIGVDNTGRETKHFVCDWADKIVVMSKKFIDFVPRHYLHKVILLEVGDDVWGSPFAEDLQLKIVRELNSNPFFWDSAICNYKFNSINTKEVLERIQAYKTKIAERNVTDAAL